MRLSKRMFGYVAFANFCAEHSVKPVDLAELITLADRAYRFNETGCNRELTERESKADKRNDLALHAKAGAMGFGVEFNGLYPTLRRDNQDVHFPSID